MNDLITRCDLLCSPIPRMSSFNREARAHSAPGNVQCQRRHNPLLSHAWMCTLIGAKLHFQPCSPSMKLKTMFSKGLYIQSTCVNLLTITFSASLNQGIPFVLTAEISKLEQVTLQREIILSVDQFLAHGSEVSHSQTGDTPLTHCFSPQTFHLPTCPHYFKVVNSSRELPLKLLFSISYSHGPSVTHECLCFHILK